MNMLQYKRTTGLLEPMLGFFQAQLSLFRMGKETLNKQTEEYLSDITTSVQRYVSLLWYVFDFIWF